ncbi:Guanylate-binding protein 5 [Apodemus speciosus]|uniref:Guanylate-binding protein 5 n=1 Tax=Apodemus speciosus TaxID=105296 RepID=A0ABQ0EM87_APOSI
MASEDNMPHPVCLIENVKGQLRANQEALSILSSIQQPVVVVAIVGPYHTGKSYLMNKLAGKKTGFSLGSTVQAETKGIWMWCVPHPQKPEHTLVLLDTEGLGDVEKGDNQNDCWIFALAILLSSTFIYNSMGVINQQAMDQLQLCTDQKEKEKQFNLPRLCIRKFFPMKKCFIFERPAPGKKLGQLESLQNQDLDSDFVVQVAEFCSYVFRSSKVKRISGGLKVNGPRLKSLVTTYVNTISNGSLPCIESAVLTLAQIENSAAVQKAITHYDQQMSQRVQLPTETLQELLDLHRTCEKEAIKIFMENSFKNFNQTKLETNREEFCKKNLQASSDYCSALLQDLFSPLEEDVKQGTYFKPGGYCVFMRRIKELKKSYYEEPKKGVLAEETLQKFLQSKEDLADVILQTDQILREKAKEIEVERVKAESAQATAKIQEEIKNQSDQLMKEKEKFYMEQFEELTKKIEKKQAQLREEQQKGH